MKALSIFLALALVIGASACSDDGEKSAAAGPTSVVAVLEQIDGLDTSARTEKLLELVQDEGGSLTFYSSMSADNSKALAAAFEDAYDIDVKLFRADSESVAQRITEETSAGTQGADVAEVAGLLLEQLDPTMFSAYRSPYQDELVEGSVHEIWTADQQDVFVASWNTDSVPAGSEPSSWEDLADPKWKGRLVMEVEDVEWYYGLRQHWIEDGKTDAEAEALFMAMAANARFVKGHSLMAQLLASGEFDVAASPFWNGVRRIQAKGAPITSEPYVEPLIATTSGVALLDNIAHPAAAVLFADWLLSDAQDLFAGLDILPVRNDLQAAGGAEVLNVDLAALSKEFDSVRDRYSQLSGGQTVIKDES